MSLCTRLFYVGLIFGLVSPGCKQRLRYPDSDSGLKLDKVVLYRNGVGYFDYLGQVKDGRLRLRVPREQLNDILKSLTVLDSKGEVLRVSMPLDASALRHQDPLAQEHLHGTLKALKGTPVELVLKGSDPGRLRGRIFQVESIAPPLDEDHSSETFEGPELDHRVSLINDRGIVSSLLSQITGVDLLDAGIRLSLDRALDSSSGQGSLQLVDVEIVVSKRDRGEVAVSYVVEAPVWKPTYRVVIPQDAQDEVLLQGWAVVHNMSGENWDDVQLSLAAGAPIAFRYDMHRPSLVQREDLSWMQRQGQAQVAVGDASADEVQDDMDETHAEKIQAPRPMEMEQEEMAEADIPAGAPALKKKRRDMSNEMVLPPNSEPRPPKMPELAKSVPRIRKSRQVAGLTKISMGHRLSIPQGQSSMLAFVNERVPGSSALLYRPGGAGHGYENHPYRVLRFRNQTPLRLESGPISLYAGGTFVGEGIAEPIGSGAWATIPYAVETDIEVASTSFREASPMRVLRISSGVLEVEQFSQRKLTWKVKSIAKREVRDVYIDQVRSGPRYDLVSPSPDAGQVEVFPDFYRFHLVLPKGAQKTSLDVLEKTPSSFSLSIWDGRAIELLEYAMKMEGISRETKARLEPLVRLRRELGVIDTKLEGLERQRRDLQMHAEQIRLNLNAIAKDRAAKALRKELSNQLRARSQKIDRLGREMVALRTERLKKRLSIEELVQSIDLDLASGAPTQGPRAKGVGSNPSK